MTKYSAKDQRANDEIEVGEYSIKIESWGNPDGSGDAFGYKFVAWIKRGSMIVSQKLGFDRDEIEADAIRTIESWQR